MPTSVKTLSLGLVAVGLGVLPSLALAVDLINPLGEGVTDPRLIIGNIIQAVLSLVGSLALLMFVYGGVLWITSFGEEKRISKGKTIIVWAVLGLALIASAYVIVNAVINGLTQGNING
jgi:hypothetical protein